jgi:DNA-binding transcriptional LysR family regulator
MNALNRISLNGLRAIETVARHGALGPAAEELGVTPGAVSQQIIKAEQQLGRPVFRRLGKRLPLSEFGAAIVPHLSDGFRQLARAASMARERSDCTLTISVAPVLASKWLVPRLGEFARLYPDIRIRIDATVELVDFTDSDVDLALRVGTGGWPDVEAESLIGQEIFPVCALALAQRIRQPSDVLEVPAVVDVNWRIGWDIWCDATGLPRDALNISNSFTDASLCLDAAIAGQGVMLAWQTLAEYALAKGTLVAPFREKIPTGSFYWLVTPKDRRLPDKAEKFRRWVAAEFAATEAHVNAILERRLAP